MRLMLSLENEEKRLLELWSIEYFGKDTLKTNLHGNLKSILKMLTIWSKNSMKNYFGNKTYKRNLKCQNKELLLKGQKRWDLLILTLVKNSKDSCQKDNKFKDSLKTHKEAPLKPEMKEPHPKNDKEKYHKSLKNNL